MITIKPEKLIEEFKNRNIDAILLINNSNLFFFVKNEETKEIIHDFMLQNWTNNFFYYIKITDIFCEGLAIIPVYNLNLSFSIIDPQVNKISFDLPSLQLTKSIDVYETN